jgi:hypothetical protein
MLHRPLLRPLPGGQQALALAGAHGAVVEVEMQEADRPGLFVANVLPGSAGGCEVPCFAGQRRFRDARQLCGKDLRCRQLEGPGAGLGLGVDPGPGLGIRLLLAAHMADPQRTVHRRAQDRRFAPGDHVTGSADA